MDKDKFWTSDFKLLYPQKDIMKNIMLNNKMSIEEKMNTLTRVIIILFILSIFFLPLIGGLMFLLISILIIIFLYNIILYCKENKRMKVKENYNGVRFNVDVSQHIKNSANSRKLQDHNSISKCNNNVSLSSSIPKKSPITYTMYGIHGHVKHNETLPALSKNQRLAYGKNIKEIGHPRTKVSPISVAPLFEINEWSDNPSANHPQINSDNGNVDLYNSGFVDTNCNDNLHENIDYSTEIVENYESPDVFEYGGENVQNIQPNVYTVTEQNVPSHSNIGISYTPQNSNYTTRLLDDVDVEIYHDPLLEDPLKDVKSQNKYFEISNAVTEANVYDPRNTSYGTSYRSYNHDLTGQTRFFYDDVDAVRTPNYITRNKLDHTDFGDRYGPIKAGEEFGNRNNHKIREMAEKSWVDDSLMFRDDLMKSSMRKINNTAWQQKVAPIRTSVSGGSSSIKRI